MRNSEAEIDFIDVLLLGGKVELLEGKVYRYVTLSSKAMAAETYERLVEQTQHLSRVSLNCEETMIEMVIEMETTIYRLPAFQW